MPGYRLNLFQIAISNPQTQNSENTDFVHVSALQLELGGLTRKRIFYDQSQLCLM